MSKMGSVTFSFHNNCFLHHICVNGKPLVHVKILVTTEIKMPSALIHLFIYL